MGLGGVNASEEYQEVSKESLNNILSTLKERFTEGLYPNLDERIDRINRLKDLVEENMDAFHKALEKDFGTRHEQLSLLSDTMPVINNAKHALTILRKWTKPERG